MSSRIYMENTIGRSQRESPAVRTGASLHGLLLLICLRRSLWDDQKVLYAEYSRVRFGLYIRNRCIALVIDDAIQGDVAVLHNNVDRVVAPRRIGGNSAGHPGDAASRANRLLVRPLVGVIFA